MKPISDDMMTLILTQRQFSIAELYTVTLRNGTVDRFTDLDIPIDLSGVVYKANSLRFEGLRFKLAIGWEADEQEIRISADPNDELAGAGFFLAVGNGLLDGAIISRSRAFWVASENTAYYTYGTDPVGVVPLFTGLVSTITGLGRTHVDLKLKSPMALLNKDMPHNVYQAGCLWTLFDEGCTLSKAAFTFSGVVEVVDENFYGSISVVGGIPDPVGGDGLATYAQGRLLFTSGVNINTQVSIRYNDATIFYYTFPPILGVVPGDTFDAWPGCSKTVYTCLNKFNNKANFRGFPRVPPIVMSA